MFLACEGHTFPHTVIVKRDPLILNQLQIEIFEILIVVMLATIVHEGIESVKRALERLQLALDFAQSTQSCVNERNQCVHI